MSDPAAMNSIIQGIGRYSRFTLLTHVSPDGDTLGSALAVYSLLTGLGKTAEVVCEEPVPHIYGYLPNADKVVLPETNGLVTRAAVAGSTGIRAAGKAAAGTASADGAGKHPQRQSGVMSARGGEKLPLLLYAHSMGGCVSTLFLEKYPEYFRAAVLSSPMLKMTFGSIPLWQVKTLMFVSRLLGWNEKTMPGQNGFDPEKPDFEGSASLSRARFDYQWDLRADPASGGIYTMNGGTYRWGRAAWKATQELLKGEEKITIPVLVCQAGLDYFVDNEGQDHFVKTAPNARLVRFPEAKHEIYGSEGETLERYYREVLGFYRTVTER